MTTLPLLADAAANPDLFSKLSLGSGTILIFAACAAFSLIRGLFRMIIGVVTLCAAAYTGYVVWGHFPSSENLPWLSFAVPAGAGLAVFVALTAVVKFFSRPFTGGVDGGGNGGLVHKLMRMGFSLVPASALWFSGATALHHAGSVAEINNYADSGGEGSQDTKTAFLTHAKELIDKYLPSGLFQKVDPLSDEARVKLAKLIAASDSGNPPPKAIPVLEEPEIRQVILNDPHLRHLARERRYADILRDPRLDHIVDNPDLRRMLADTPL